MAVTFVVETGAGVTGATSYLTLAAAEQYILDFGLTCTAWTAASDDQKKVGLNVAARYLDATYGQRWRGKYRKDPDQGLMWPRVAAVNDDGVDYDDEVPVKLMQAATQLAVYWVTNGSLFPSADLTGQLKSESIKIDVLEISKEYMGGSITGEIDSTVDGLMLELIECAGSSRVVRG